MLALLFALPGPGHATHNAGGGYAVGTFTYDPGAEMPPVLRPCQPTSFDVDLTSAPFVVNTTMASYAGEATIEGEGVSGCESTTAGGGELSLSIEGFNPVNGSQVSCPTMVGGYTRIGTRMTVVFSGECNVGGGTGMMNVIGQLEFVPVGAGAGVVSSVSTAAVTGPLVISPA